MARVIAFVSGKGGVGKTTVSVNVAQSLFDSGKKVLLIDANITTPNISLHYSINPSKHSIHDVLGGKIDIGKVIYKTETGLMIIPGGLNFNNLKTKIKKSLSDTLLSLIDKFDYLIIDAGAGLGLEAKMAIRACEELVLVTNPDLPAITDALRAKKIAEDFRINLLGVVINKKTGMEFDLKDDNISDFLELPIIGEIPFDPYVPKSIKERVPVVVGYPLSKASKAIKRLVNNITNEELFIEDKPDNSFIKWIKKVLGLNP
ncbi:MAG: cell division ATPase MinD [Candidatus Nanoarchaeia archaeon]|nr:cell division ATPase MinD [Candidatus Nanoarchaeia archaeon]MDD5054276.1 cell division ATPase MinD [Candidatus Nanoarchaeia archaeon]MDD5499962.1 cell division ATPase MinD [Candidatus Nanoarchaeia archaeon]